jgi:hypothetical protein
VSILSTFQKQLLHVQIPKAQKKIENLTVFLALLGSACEKAPHRTLMELAPGIDGIKPSLI